MPQSFIGLLPFALMRLGLRMKSKLQREREGNWIDDGARIILCGRKHDHVTPLLRELHWLPVEQRIIFKILFFTFKALNNLCPSYISDLLETYKLIRSIRSSSRNLLVIPRSKLKSYGDRAFSASAPKCGMTFLKP